MIVLDRIEREFVVSVWPLLEPLFRKANEKAPSDLTPDLILDRASDGRLTLWAIYNHETPTDLLAAVATGIHTDGMVCEIFALGGKRMTEWLGLRLAELEGLARRQGVIRMRLEGRRGWAKVLTGYTVIAEMNDVPRRVRLEKDL